MRKGKSSRVEGTEQAKGDARRSLRDVALSNDDYVNSGPNELRKLCLCLTRSVLSCHTDS